MTDTTTTQAQHAEAVAGNNVLSLEEADRIHETINLLERENQILTTLLESPNTPNTCLLYTSPSPRD